MCLLLLLQIVVFDPIDGSANIDTALTTGSIFGIYGPDEHCLLDTTSDDFSQIDEAKQQCIVNVCQPGSNLLAAGYCLYSSSTVFTLTLATVSLFLRTRISKYQRLEISTLLIVNPKTYQLIFHKVLKAEDIWVTIMNVSGGFFDHLPMDIIEEQLALVHGYSSEKDQPQKPLFVVRGPCDDFDD